MVYYAAFVIFIAIIFFLILPLIKKIIPVSSRTLYLVISAALILTLAFPYSISAWPWQKVVFVYFWIVIICSIIACYLDFNVFNKVPAYTGDNTPHENAVLEKQWPTVYSETTVNDIEKQGNYNTEYLAATTEKEHEETIPETATYAAVEASELSIENTSIRNNEINENITFPERTVAYASNNKELKDNKNLPAVSAPFEYTYIFNRNNGLKKDPTVPEVTEPIEVTPVNTNISEKDNKEYSLTGKKLNIPEDIDEYISLGFEKRFEGDLRNALECFIKAMHLTNDAELSVRLGLEVSSIYYQLGQKWQAAEILNTIMDTWGMQLDKHLIDKLKRNLNSLYEQEVY